MFTWLPSYQSKQSTETEVGFVQFATELPVAGSSFTYVVASLGQLPAFLVMVNMVRPSMPSNLLGAYRECTVPLHFKTKQQEVLHGSVHCMGFICCMELFIA